MKEKILIIGGDSTMAKFLIPQLNKENFEFVLTTRSRKKVSKSKIFLDLTKIDKFVVPKKTNSAIVLAGIDGHEKCKKNYNYSYLINSICVPNLIKKLIIKKVFVCFVNTSAIFSKTSNLPKENSQHYPSQGYGMQKSIAEKKIINFAKKGNKLNMLSILRVTKNVHTFTKIFNSWIKNINKRKKFSALKDLFFAPISYYDTAKLLLKIIKKKQSGIMHLSGEKDISYYNFAKRLLIYNNFNPNLAIPSNSYEEKKILINSNQFTALCMKKTSKKLKIKPVKILKIIKLISSEIN